MKLMKYMSKNKLLVLMGTLYFVICIVFATTQDNNLIWLFGPLTMAVFITYAIAFYKYRKDCMERE